MIVIQSLNNLGTFKKISLSCKLSKEIKLTSAYFFNTYNV